VDEVTQWEVTVAVECISEKYLLPALKMALAYFPFKIINFHSDNGSEFINYTVAHLLNKLNIAQTKSRARTSTDNGLVESKNGAIIRKEFGHWHIP
jgi:transposase InsO family protein